MRKEIIAALWQEADPEYRQFIQKLTPGAGTVIGIRMPRLRQIARQILARDPQTFLQEAEYEIYEETILTALVLGSWQTDFTLAKKYDRKLIRHMKNWAVCDTFTSSLRHCRTLDRQQLRQFITPYLHSQREFDQRFALTALLNCQRDRKAIPAVLHELNSLPLSGYYAKMAAAWLIAEYAAIDSQTVYRFLKQYTQDPAVKKEAVRKIQDSYRITDSFKHRCKALLH